MAETITVAPPEQLLAQVNSLKAAIGTLPQLLDDLRSHNLPESAISDAEQNLKVGVNLLEANLPRICFLGKTGSGKTSLMNALLGKTLLPAEDTGKAGLISCDVASGQLLVPDRWERVQDGSF